MFHRRQFQSIGFVVSILGAVMVGTVSTLCPTPRCVTYDEINTLWVDPNPARFLQCRPDVTGGWSLQQMPCAPGTLFSFSRQVCVLPAYWSTCAEVAPSAEPCEEPRCITYAQINTLWVHKLTNKFYQCRPVNGTWTPQEMPCAPGTLYSFKHQTCVQESMWKSSC
uniref:Chitin-binding type-2 domain-containing protein n=1 Tax=Anopheles minimus TaxID=112268 RepID=A0A182W4W8_9DIPT